MVVAKINGVVNDKVSRVYIAPAKRTYTSNLIYEGEIFGDSWLFRELFDKEFTLEYNGFLYTGCQTSSTDSGKFLYFRVNPI